MTMQLGDLGLICFLTYSGVKWTSLDRIGGRVVATFEDTPTVRELRKKYIQDLATVAPRSFLGLFRDLKTELKDYNSIQQPPQLTMKESVRHETSRPDPPR